MRKERIMKKKDNTKTQPEENPNQNGTSAEAEVQDAGAEVPESEASQPEASIAEWQEALELAVKQRDEYLDSLRRTQADFQNFKRRNQTARSDGYEDGVRETIAAMLPVIDNLERAIGAAEQQGESQALVDGVKMTLSTLFESLKRFGFEEVPALGEMFDPEKHNAVMRESSEEPGKVLEVFQKGYRVKDRIIRYAMVKVSVE